MPMIPTQTVERQLASTVTTPTLADFLGVLFAPADLIELRPLRHGSKHHPDQQWLTPAELAELDVSRINADASVYFGANPRPKRGDSKNDHIALCRCVLADFDNGITPEQAAARIELAALPHPSAIVASGGGTHCYWLLDKPTDPETWRATQKGIIEVLGCDNIHDPARVMRLPGTINRKLKRNGAECRLVEVNDTLHRLADFPQVEEPVVESKPRVMSPPPPTPSNAADRCIKYLEKIPDAISGQDGHGRTLQAACECYRFGLSDGDAASVMRWFNESKCAPAWTEGELQHKLDSAKAKVGKASEIGMRLTEARDTASDDVSYIGAGLATTTTTPDNWTSRPFAPIDEDPSSQLTPEVIPDSLRDLVVAISRELEVPLELPLACALGVASAACQPRWTVSIKDKWTEPTSLFIAVPADPGERKTPVLKKFLNPLIEAEKNDRERCNEANKASASKRAVVAKRLKGLENEAAKSDDLDALAVQMDKARGEMPPLETPKRLYVDDTTPEQLAVVMRDAGGSIAAITDEGGALLSRLAGHYSGVPNIDAALKGWDNGPLRIDRANGRDVYLNAARLSMTLLMQKSVARDALTNPEFMGRGLVHRFLWLLPSNAHIGYRTGKTPSADDALLRSWSRLIAELLSWSPAEVEDCGTTTHIINLTDAARACHHEYTQQIEAAIRGMDEADPRRTYRQKWPGQTARIAGVLHCLEQAAKGKPGHAAAINEQSMRRAISLASVLLDHADKAMAMLGQDLRIERAMRIVARVKAAGEPCKLAELWVKMRNVKSLFDEKSQFDDAVKLLMHRGYVETKEEGKTTRVRLTPPALKTP